MLRKAGTYVLLAIWSCLLFVGTLNGSALSATNLVVNGGFESGLWTERSGNFSLDTVESHSGTRSLRVSGGTAEQYAASAPIAVNPNFSYKIVVWVKSDLTDSRPVLSLNVLQGNSSNQSLGWYPNSASKKLVSSSGRQIWTHYDAVISNLNLSTSVIKIYLRLDSGASGTVWFDDITMEPLNTAEAPGFEAGLWSLNSGAFINDLTVFHTGARSAAVTGQSSTSYLGTVPIPVTTSESYKLSLWIKTNQITTSNGISVNILEVNANNQSLGWLNNNFKLLSTGGTQDWTRYETSVSGFKADTVSLRIYLRADAGIGGTAWFDDVEFIQAYRNHFSWGVNGHNKSYPVYPASQLGSQIQKAKDLGISGYRINVAPDITDNGYDWTYMDQVVDTAFNQGLKLYAVLYSGLTPTAGQLQQYGQAIAERYRGKIAYYQLGNERDIYCFISPNDGTSPSHYDAVKYNDTKSKITALGTGIITGDPYARRVINIGGNHTGFLERLQADGVQWEVNAIDWYGDASSLIATLSVMQNYVQNEILIAEGNIHYGTYTATEQEQADYLTATANQVYYGAPAKVNGYYVYELLDESNLTGPEGDYGLVRYSNGTIGAEKQAFGAFRNVIQRKP